MPVSGDPSPFSDSTTSNWVARRGGLPGRVRAVARAIKRKNPSWPLSRCIAVAINTLKYSAATGDSRLPGVQREHGDVVQAHRAAIAHWEAMKGHRGGKSRVAASHSPNVVESSMPDADPLALAAADRLGLSHEQWARTPETFRARAVLALAGAWDASKHPRAPKGSAGGGRFSAGTARTNDGGAAQKAQKNTQAADAADQLMKMSPAQRQAYLDSLSDDELKALSAYMYSFKSADAGVVQGRTAIAGGLARRGLNVNNYGGLGPKNADKPRPAGAPPVGGLKKPAPAAKSAAKKPTVPGKKPAAPARKAAPTKRQPARRQAPARRAPVANKPGATATKAQQAQAVQAVKTRHSTLNSSHGDGGGLRLAVSSTMSGDGPSVTITADQRQKWAKSGVACPDGSFPIPDKAHLRKAVKALGRAPESKRGMVKKHIAKRARALGVPLPDAVK